MTADGTDAIAARKREHIRFAQGDVEARAPAGWADIELVHRALPEIDLGDVDLGVEFLGTGLRAPVVLAAMTGGYREAAQINAMLARAAERHGLAMGLGSQRAALRDPSLAGTYAAARQAAPGAFLIGNVGAPQLVPQGEEPALQAADVDTLISMIEANALAVHLNWLEESVQLEGNRAARGGLAALAALVESLDGRVPVIAKETGAGLSREAAADLAKVGVAALDVGGRGGTSFAAVEGQRAEAHGDTRRARLGEVFRDWGLPTAVSVRATLAGADLPVIATGGIRSGLDAAKALALGASLVGVARPMLEAAMAGEDELDHAIESYLGELSTAMFLTGSATLAELRTAPRVVLGDTARWLEQLELDAG